MTNIFNSTSRFAGLIENSDYDKTTKSVKLMKKMGWKEGNGLGKNEDGIKMTIEVEKREGKTGLGFIADEKKVNVFKDNHFRENDFRERRQNRYISESERQRIMEQYRVQEKIRKDFEKQEDDKKNLESLKIENFPELIIKKIEDENQLDISYIDKLKKTEEPTERIIDFDLENLKPGWSIIKKDKLSGKIIIKNKVQTNTISIVKEEEEIPINVFDELVELHQRRTEEYIELNGYDTWEKMFKFPNWRECENEFEDNSDDELENDLICEDDDE